MSFVRVSVFRVYLPNGGRSVANLSISIQGEILLPILKKNIQQLYITVQPSVSILTILSSEAYDNASAYHISHSPWWSYDVKDIKRRQLRRHKCTTSFWFGDIVHTLRRSNINVFAKRFDDISQSAAEILLFPLSENKRRPYWNSTSGFHFTLSSSSACNSASTY